MKAYLVCKGGGVQGIALIGAISYLEEHGYIWDKVAGTSAGAIVSSLLAVGYTSKELKDIMTDLNYKNFKDKNKLQSIPFVGQLASLLLNKGLYSGNYLEKFLTDKFKAKGKVKFKDISINGNSKLKITASDITKKELIILPDDLVKYNLDPMEFEIAKAVRMSMSIPFYYNPVILKDKKNTSFIVDGGLISNFPIWIFDVNGDSKYPTFGLNLVKSPKKNPLFNKSSLISYMLDVTETALSFNEEVYVNHKDSVRTINIPTLGIEVIDFDLTKEESEKLFESGYTSAKNFFNTYRKIHGY